MSLCRTKSTSVDHGRIYELTIDLQRLQLESLLEVSQRQVKNRASGDHTQSEVQTQCRIFRT